MARIPENFIQEVIQRTDIVELINSRVPLKKTGRNHSACCPFHNEKTPSFTVNADKQFFYCFGCNASGNAVTFLMEYDGVSFPQAVEALAQQAGMEVPKEEESQEDKARRQQSNTLLELTQRADLYYRQQLRGAAERQTAVDYLKSRAISGEIAAKFGLGFAPPGYDNLMSHLSLNSEGLANAITAGLLVKRDDSGRIYDKFRHRIMFPIRNIKGETIAFGGRLLGDGKPKYLNSPETPLFHKGRELYGLWEWRQSRDNSDQIFVVEGYMDVIALAQHQIPNVVATLGTATSEHHLRRLFQLANQVVFCFDGDDAGRRAAWRALEITLPVLEDGKQALFLFLPEGEDPDSLVRTQSREGFLVKAEQAMPLSEFLFAHLGKPYNLDTVDGRVALARAASPYLQQVQGDFYRHLLRRELSERTRLTEEELETLIYQATKPVTQQPKTTKAPTPTPTQHHRFTRETPRRTHTLTLAEQLIVVLLNEPERTRQFPLPEKLSKLDLPHIGLLKRVYQQLSTTPDLSPAALLGRLMAQDQGQHLGQLLRTAHTAPMDQNTTERFCQDALLQLEIRIIEQDIIDESNNPTPNTKYLLDLHKQLSERRTQLSAPL